jgi:hypothetical protein
VKRSATRDRSIRGPAFSRIALRAIRATKATLPLAGFLGNDVLAFHSCGRTTGPGIKLYDHAAIEAERRGWPTANLHGTHLHPTLHPAETANAILSMSRQLVPDGKHIGNDGANGESENGG